MLDLLKQGGVVMYPLGLCSLLTIAIAIECLWRFRRADRNPEKVIDQAQKAWAQGGNPKPVWTAAASPAEKAVAAAFNNLKRSRQAVEESVRAALTSENLRLNSHLGIVGTIGNISPFIGLFGTVLGIIRAFRDIGEVGAAGPAVVAAGISEALIATATGLFVAITAVIVYNAFLIWEGRIQRRAEIVAAEAVNLVTEGSPHGNEH